MNKKTSLVLASLLAVTPFIVSAQGVPNLPPYPVPTTVNTQFTPSIPTGTTSPNRPAPPMTYDFMTSVPPVWTGTTSPNRPAPPMTNFGTTNNLPPVPGIGNTIFTPQQSSNIPSPFSRTLIPGSRGSEVATLQLRLIALRLLSIDKPTGFFGPMTQRAVERFQAANGIVTSGTPGTTGFGQVGPRTGIALGGVNATTSGSVAFNPASGAPPIPQPNAQSTTSSSNTSTTSTSTSSTGGTTSAGGSTGTGTSGTTGTSASFSVGKTLASNNDFTVVRDDIFVTKNFTDENGNNLIRTGPFGSTLDINGIIRNFSKSFPNKYDFIILYSDYNIGAIDGVQGAFLSTKDRDEGIGVKVSCDTATTTTCKTAAQTAAEQFGVNSKVQGVIAARADALEEGGANTYLVVHELGHRWLAYVRTSGYSSLSGTGSHWDYFIDSSTKLADGKTYTSPMGGREFKDNGNGTFTMVLAADSAGARMNTVYSSMDLYLMGFIPSTNVTALAKWIPSSSTTVPLPDIAMKGTKQLLSVNDVIAAYGARNPSASNSQKEFSIAYILAAKDSSDTVVAKVKAVADGVPNAWQKATQGYSKIIGPN